MFLDAVKLGVNIGIAAVSAGAVVAGFALLVLFLFAVLSPTSTKK